VSHNRSRFSRWVRPLGAEGVILDCGGRPPADEHQRRTPQLKARLRIFVVAMWLAV